MTEYRWVFVKDVQGVQGVPGRAGPPGLTSTAAATTDAAVAANLDTENESQSKTAVRKLIGQWTSDVRVDRDFVKGDGTNETAGFQAALDFQAGSNKKKIVIPPDFTITTQGNLYSRSGTHIIGSAGSVVDMKTVDGIVGRFRSYGIEDFSMENLLFDCSNAPERLNGPGSVAFQNAVGVRLLNVGSKRTPGTAFWFGSSSLYPDWNDDIVMTDCFGHDCLADGLHISRQSRNMTINNWISRGNADDGIGIVGYMSDGAQTYGAPYAIKINGGGSFDHVDGRGLAIVGARDVQVDGYYVRNVQRQGILLGRDANCHWNTDIQIRNSKVWHTDMQAYWISNVRYLQMSDCVGVNGTDGNMILHNVVMDAQFDNITLRNGGLAGNSVSSTDATLLAEFNAASPATAPVIASAGIDRVKFNRINVDQSGRAGFVMVGEPDRLATDISVNNVTVTGGNSFHETGTADIRLEYIRRLRYNNLEMERRNTIAESNLLTLTGNVGVTAGSVYKEVA